MPALVLTIETADVSNGQYKNELFILGELIKTTIFKKIVK